MLSFGFLSLWASSRAADNSGPAVQAIIPGDIAISGFSGSKLSSPTLPPGVDPIDKTVIDVDGASVRVFDLSSLGGPFAAQLVNPPVKMVAKARDVGQVFALAFDDGKGSATGTPNLYAAATAAFGISIVTGGVGADGKPMRLKKGELQARFMDGQFGGLAGGSPGSIWKIDGATGAASLLADTAFSGLPNSGPGIGGLAFDPLSRNLYASDLDTGLIHRFALDYNAADLGQFDHGAARVAQGLPAIGDDGIVMDITSPNFRPDDVATWGLTQAERRVHALAVHRQRLYYALAQGPAIWSVGLKSDGGFDTDPRQEVAVKALQPLPVTAIAFDGQGRMLLAQRGTQTNPFDFSRFAETGSAQVLRYIEKPENDTTTPAFWLADPQEYAVGFAEGNRMAAGGIAIQYGYRSDGRIDLGVCGGAVVMTGDALRDNAALAAELAAGGAATVHGVQLNGEDLVAPVNTPPRQSIFVDYDGRFDDADARGRIGAVAAFRNCGSTSASSPAATPSGTTPPVTTTPSGATPPPVTSTPSGATAPPDTTALPVTTTPSGATPPPVATTPPGVTPTPDNNTPQTPVITKKALATKCSAAGGCAFEITITNPGAVPIPGPFVIEDTLSAAGVTLDKVTITAGPDPSWTCTGAGPVTCVHAGALPPGPTSLQLTFTPTGIGSAKEVKNCAVAPQPVPVGPTPKPTLGPNNGATPFLSGTMGCTGFTPPKALFVHQDNGYDVTFNLTDVDVGQGILDGTATYITENGAVTGTATGTINGNAFDVTVFWSNGTVGRYRGFVGADGKLVGATLNASGHEDARIKSSGLPVFACNHTSLCDNYADIAVGQASLNVQEICGNTGPRWSLDRQGHVDWCMSINGDPGLLNAEMDARDAGLKACVHVLGKKTSPASTSPSPAPPPPQQCATIPIDPTIPPPPLGPKLRPEKTFISGDCATGCDFDIKIRNVGTQVFSGPMFVEDIVRGADGKIAPSEIVSAVSPGLGWQCTPGSGFFVCKLTDPNPVVLQPGQAVDLVLKLKIDQLGFNGTNCAISAANPITVDDNDPANGNKGSCVPVKTFIPTPQLPKGPIPIIHLEPNIAMDKAAPNVGADGVGSCTLNDPCRFTIHATNTGDGEYVGKIRVVEQVTGSAVSSLGQGPGSPPGWTCTSGGAGVNTIACETNDVRTLPPHSSVELEIAVVAGPEWKKNDVLTNCVTFSYQFGNDKGGNKTDDQACAKVKLDPFALNISKTGSQSCQPGGECSFSLRIFDPGPIDHNAPVIISDNLSGIGPAQIVSIVPPLPCAQQPTQIPFQCTTDVQHIAAGQDLGTYVITVKLPAAADGAASFRNCASLADGSPREAGADRANPTSCHDVQLAPAPAPRSGPVPILPPVPPAASTPPSPPPPPSPGCFGGMVLDAARFCACPRGMVWSGRSCVAQGPSPTVCPPGSTGVFPDCRATTPSSGANPIQPSTACPPGSFGLPPNCRQLCPAGDIGTFPNCSPATVRVCPPGTVGTFPNCSPTPSSGSNPVQPSPPSAACPPGTVGTPPNCRPLTPSSGASPIQPSTACPPGSFGLPPNCRRLGGATPSSGANAVQPSQPSATCPLGMSSIKGVCRRIFLPQQPIPQQKPAQQPQQPPRRCPSGTFGVPPLCRPIPRLPTPVTPSQKCPPGLSGPRCNVPVVH
jgi:hypothetical protein